MPMYLDSPIPPTRLQLVTVSRVNAQRGRRGSPYACPIALALTEAGFHGVWVSDGIVSTMGYQGVARAERWQLNYGSFLRMFWFDLTGRMKPFTARLWRWS